MSSILEIKDLSVTFGKSPKKFRAVNNINLCINKGETVALVGESGSGKSVTALSIMQLLPYPFAEHPSGVIEFKNNNLIALTENELRKIRGSKISMIFQEPLSSLNPLHSIEKQISEVLFIHKKMSLVEARARVIELLKLVGLEEAIKRLDALPHEFSGGQQQRIMIAMALANDPELLIADEPTTALDVTIQAQVLVLLKTLQKKLGMAILFITHNLSIVKKMADTIYVMKDGSILEKGPVTQVFQSPGHPFTQHLLDSEPKGEVKHPAFKSEISIECSNLKVWYPIKRGVLRKVVGHIKAVDGVSLEIRKGHTLGVVGESGSGKSSLGRSLVRLEESMGLIKFNGKEIQNLTNDQLRPHRKHIQIVFQDPFSSLSPRLSVGQIVEEGLIVHKIGGNSHERRNLISAVLNEVGLEPSMQDRYPHEFSGGQRQRIAISRALILKPELIIFDEPTSALDVSVQAQIIDLLKNLQENYNLTYMFISHDLRVVRAISHNLAVMKQGKIIEAGPTQSIIKNPMTPYTQTLMRAAFDIEIAKEPS